MSKLTAHETAYRWLTHRIRAVPPNEGTYLLEVEVAEAAEVSRTPVREAMTRLQAEGLVQRTPRKGVYVPPISDAEIGWLTESRELIELHAFASVLGDKGTAEAMADALRRQEEVTDGAEFIELDHDFHNAAVTAAGNSFQIASYKLLEERQIRLGRGAVAVRDERRDDVLREHRAILNAFVAEDLPALRAAVAEHLDRTQESLNARRSPGYRASRVTSQS
ncbi:GntR family transcriptional regulator [Microbacterium sp. SSW1-49]|uniref:GntR family transcriptional regulator n=1 Tax=Microbacterium croceum TaxID=2851645 RepID=A0ABT0FDE3_9MICO|nr:GntR family transcriptional regulator [Microbacterium croceum]MCK2035714.1 GntR family transcriptional regulator [Microbacterium croceum]